MHDDRHINKFFGMTRYSKTHKAQSRNALLQSAATLFRRHGYRGVGIDDLCAQAGLTRGAFYAHFKSKAALLAEVMRGPHDFVRRLQARRTRDGRGLRRGAVRVAQDYLQAEHRDAVVGGCSLASLAMDTARADAPTQKAYALAVEQVVEEIRRGTEITQAQAHAALALCVGGLLISAACGREPSANQMSRAARKAVRQILEENDACDT